MSNKHSRRGCYQYGATSFVVGDRVTIHPPKFDRKEPDAGMSGTVLAIKAGGLVVRVGTAAVGHTSFWHPGALRLANLAVTADHATGEK